MNATNARSRICRYGRGSELAARVIALLLGIGLLADTPAASAGQDRLFDTPEPCRVRFQDGLLSLHAAQRPWREVLHEIQRKTGMRIHHAHPLKGSVSASIEARPVQEALKRLFGGDASFIFHYPAGASRSEGMPRDVWILGNVGVRELKAAELAQPASPDRPATDPSAQVFDDAAPDEAALRQHLLAMIEDDDPGVRAQAVMELANPNDPEDEEVRGVLDAALADQDPNVRGAAIQAVVSFGDSEALGQLRQALQDPDPGVRVLAVESVVPGTEGEALLDEALSDSDGTVRLMAAERLKAREAESRDLAVSGAMHSVSYARINVESTDY